jgi:hypothetical protein
MARSLFSAVTSTGAQAATSFGKSNTVQVWGTTTSGSGSATIVIEATNDGTAPWVTLATITLTLGTTATGDGLVIDADWETIRGNVTSLSGTGASVSAALGAQ